MRRDTTQDKTVERNYLEKYRFMVKEYELIKAGNHPQFRFVQDFYKAHDTDRRSFIKYYNRYKQSGSERDLLLASEVRVIRPGDRLPLLNKRL